MTLTQRTAGYRARTAGVTLAVGLTAALAACNGPRRIHENPVMINGDRVGSSDATVQAVAASTAAERETSAARRDSLRAVAAANCAPAVCAALARGELALSMTMAQVMAATGSSESAWSVRDAGGTTVMVARTLEAPPRDATGEVAMVQLAGGRATSYSYREPQGLRVVSAPSDTTLEGRSRAIAAVLIREGDALDAAGDRAKALDRYDRALVLQPNDPMLQYRVATLLDLQLRPVEAQLRYRRFLQELELQRIEAVGDANAKLAEAIARAQQRLIILERQSR
jgi:hypothetical protein